MEDEFNVKYEQFLLDIYARLLHEVELVLKDLTVEELNFRPGAQSNSIGWLVWHTTRSQDRMNADLFGEEQIWISGKWYLRFKREPNPKDTGFGHTNNQAAEFRAPDAETCLNYYQAVFTRTREYILTHLSSKDLQREVFSPTMAVNNTVEQRLIGTINNLQHIGQAGYIRGLREGIGWYGF
jgi:hypothetical protein